jgi:uncharacterized membrane protein HdeD (DUF308 family)
MMAADVQAAVATAVLGPVKKHWILLLAVGILMIVLGMLGFLQPIAYTVATTIFFGALLLVSGGTAIVAAFKLEGWKGRSAAILLALLYLIAGVLLVLHPVLGALTLTLVVAAFLVASGVVKIWMGFSHREQKGWGWIVASGLLSTAFGILITAQFPGSGLWVLGLFLAIELLFDGWGVVILALAAHQAQEA